MDAGFAGKPVSCSNVRSGTFAAAYDVSPIYMSLVLASSWAMGISISPQHLNKKQ
jgi:hypothetical protein